MSDSEALAGIGPNGNADRPLNGRIGEVIDSSTSSFVAEAYVLHETPPFGSFVRASAGDVEVVGVVSQARTGSVEPGRRAVARGREAEDEEEIFHDNPELSAILRSEFSVSIVGFREPGGRYLQRLPARPPRLHAHVYSCADEEVVGFTADLDYLPRLLSEPNPTLADDLVAAGVREAARARGRDRAYLVRAGKQLALMLGSDPTRLTLILRRMKD